MYPDKFNKQIAINTGLGVDPKRFEKILKRDEATLREYFKTQADIDNYLKLSPEELRDFEIIEN